MAVTGMLTTESEFSSFHGGTGIYRSQAISDALVMAEAAVEGWVETPLTSTQTSEEVPWPVDDGQIRLKRVRLITIDSVTALHNLDCDCEWQEITDCGVILNARFSDIRVVDCFGALGRCYPSSCRCPKRVRVVYTAGFTAAESNNDTKDGRLLRSAVFTAAVGFLQSSIGLDAMGNRTVGSWSSAGYSESSQFNERSGAEEMIHPMIQQAKNMVRKLTVRRAIPMRLSKGIRL